MIFTIEIFNEKGIRLLQELENLQIIRLIKQEFFVAEKQKKPKKTFSAISLDTRGFKFNRDEANER